MPAPPVYRPRQAASLQRTAAPPVYRPQPAPGLQRTATARTAVVQRVTYRGVLYEPGNNERQTLFRQKAQEDMETKGTWAPGRSETYIAEIGETTATLADVDLLSQAEQNKWRDYDRGVNQDLLGVDVVLGTITTQIGIVKTQLAMAETQNVKIAVDNAVSAVELAIGQIPAKWAIEKHTGFGTIKVAVTNYLKLEPWTRAATALEIQQLVQEINIGREKLAPLQKTPKPLKALEAKKEKAELKIQNITEKGNLARQAVDQPGAVTARIKRTIRETAKQQFARGLSAHTSAKSTMTEKKQYLGEIATTGALRNTGDKGKGVLWASPWSPGVNTAFLEGGAEGNNVFKLKTAIPDDLENFLINGQIAEFRDAVRGKTTSKYYPFWNSLENPARFTIYTEELAYLIGKGYRLHKFRRKNGQTQQLMVAPGNLGKVQVAYQGR